MHNLQFWAYISTWFVCLFVTPAHTLFCPVLAITGPGCCTDPPSGYNVTKSYQLVSSVDLSSLSFQTSPEGCDSPNREFLLKSSGTLFPHPRPKRREKIQTASLVHQITWISHLESNRFFFFLFTWNSQILIHMCQLTQDHRLLFLSSNQTTSNYTHIPRFISCSLDETRPSDSCQGLYLTFPSCALIGLHSILLALSFSQHNRKIPKVGAKRDHR